ncbi:hypothetical protein BU26DRAFT_287951 [Trematosphaeria pertusa]|uniref:Uncharacterized protein n=1 Tax=Trematosphaeria pertusa TaxID=390896 RepID=A0A6A6IJH7_9PLEO|nr:uncharacterized protein BU26DRAFT_287951 [Trematosphaeria pertusa]KAF2249703.1 hypothetical protein BU26DRAFT_287951 [Trematosphaeria pertusa]
MAVNTRRGGASAPAAAHAPAQPLHTQRATRRKAAAATAPTETVATKRRLRSAKTGNSPLRQLSTPQKRPKKSTKARSPEAEPQAEAEAEHTTDSDDDDPGAGIYFQYHKLQNRKPSELSYLELRLRNELADAAERSASALVETSVPSQSLARVASPITSQSLARVASPIPSQSLARVATPTPVKTLAQVERPALTQSGTQTEEEEDPRDAKIIELQGQVNWVEGTMTLLNTIMFGSSGQDETKSFYPDSHPANSPAVTEPSHHPSPKGTEDAKALLRFVEASARPAPQLEWTWGARADEPMPDPEPEPELEPQSETAPEEAQDEPADTEEPAVNAPTTPSQPTPSKEGIIGRIFSTLRAPFASRSATPTQASAPSSPVPDALTMTLTPTPTPVGESPNKSANKSKRKRGSTDHRQSMINAIVESVNDTAERDNAKTWAENVLAKLPLDSAILGEKRKRLEVGAVTVNDLKILPGTKPWKSGYGFDDDINMLDDEDPAPAWAVLYDMLIEEESERPAKKQKAAHEVTTDEVPSLNESFASTAGDSSPPKVVNTHGKSSSLLDVQPRPSYVASPMFGGPVIHREGGNVFGELHGQDTVEPQQTPPSNGVPAKTTVFGSFSVPDDSDSDEEEDTNGPPASLWTQQPPPAPVPAHASLPTPFGASQSIPLTQAPFFASTSQPMDEVQRARAKALKHTPAKPSRLREIHVPSPSLKSDAGDATMLTASPIASFDLTEPAFDDMPDAVSLGLSADVEADILARLPAEVGAMEWDEPVLTFSDDETTSD